MHNMSTSLACLEYKVYVNYSYIYQDGKQAILCEYVTIKASRAFCKHCCIFDLFHFAECSVYLRINTEFPLKTDELLHVLEHTPDGIKEI